MWHASCDRERPGLSEEPMPSRKAAERALTSEGCREDRGKGPGATFEQVRQRFPVCEMRHSLESAKVKGDRDLESDSQS